MHEAPTPSSLHVQDLVRQAFGWSESDDIESALQLQAALHDHNQWNPSMREKTLHKLKDQLLKAPKIVVIGAAVRAEKLRSYDEKTVFVASDGAVGALDDYTNLACVVSDLDGANYLDDAAAHGQIIVVHAHGDNMAHWQEKIVKWSRFVTPPSLVLSHQVNQTIPGMYNFGGFTDGDRAVCFILSLGVEVDKIELVGFNVERVGQWSGVTNPEKKIQKLQWMGRILSELGFGHFLNK
ncbi:MAG: hypothetical protein CBC59_000895 [Euryarchaeota archaeon TMED99]|nr:MAG: hypothetical protein CBC59_000895 [Euryarchaeota archaeon TMED99]